VAAFLRIQWPFPVEYAAPVACVALSPAARTFVFAGLIDGMSWLIDITGIEIGPAIPPTGITDTDYEALLRRSLEHLRLASPSQPTSILGHWEALAFLLEQQEDKTSELTTAKAERDKLAQQLKPTSEV